MSVDSNVIENMPQKIQQILTSIGYRNDSGMDCSEVAELLKNKLGVGRLCTIRAFERTTAPKARGLTFQVLEQSGLSEPYVYHTVLWYEHHATVYIIDGTSKYTVRTLEQFVQDLKRYNAGTYNGRVPMFVFYKGIVDDVFTRDMTAYKDARLYRV